MPMVNFLVFLPSLLFQVGQVKDGIISASMALSLVIPLYVANTLANCLFIKHSLNYTNLSIPSASCWAPELQNQTTDQRFM